MLIYMLVVVLISLHASTQEKQDKKSDVGLTKGTIMIGGLVAIHETVGENNVNCNLTDISPFGIQRVEAMRYAVHKINANSNILPNVTFGIEIRDSCGSETRALDESLRFVIDRVRVCQEKAEHRNSSMFGVVGASTSLITAEVANLLRLFRIPLISYAATSTGLSDSSKFDFLLRTVPPDSFQSLAMVNFIQTKLKWKSVFLLYSTGSYGEYGYKSFTDAIAVAASEKENRLCLVRSEKILPGASKNEIKEFLENFSEQEGDVNGIVCYCEVHDIKTIIEALDDAPDKFSRFRLIGSDNFLFGPKSNRSIIFSLHYDASELKDFHENWYNRLTPQSVDESLNPWFRKYWNRKCQNHTECSLCDRNPHTNDTSCPRDDKISHIIDAVSAFAFAIDDALRTKYRNLSRLLDSVHNKDDRFLKEHLRKVKFRGISSVVEFPANDSIARGIYDISRFDENGELTYIGLWNATKIDAVWSVENEKFFGKSSCQEQCAPGHRQRQKGSACCWRCEPCKPKEYLRAKDQCEKCQEGKEPNDRFTGCRKLPVYHIHSVWKAVIYLVTSLGIFATGYTIKTFITHNDTPLVKGSGRELTYVLLFGILMLFCVPFMLLVYPDNIICGVARFSIGFFLSICYASLLVKTNRIARIFSGRPDLLFLTPTWQVILTVFLIMPQVLINVIGLISHPPIKSIDYSFDGYGIVKCDSNTPDLIGAIAYNIVLVIVCTYYAFLTRKAPANFNEARYIGFVMYTTIVIWLAFLPVFFGTSSEYKTIFIMLDLVMNAVTLLVGLFGIKLYVIVLRPDKNSRTNSRLRSITLNSEAFFADHHDNLDAQSNYGKSPRKSVVHFRKTATDTSLVTLDGSNSSKLPRDSFCKAVNHDIKKIHEINANVLDVPLQFSNNSVDEKTTDWENTDRRNVVTKSLDENIDTVGDDFTLNDIHLRQNVRKTVTL